MTTRRYYQWALLLPVVAPLPAWAILVAIPRLPDPVATPIFALALSVVYGGVPYVLLATAFLVWMRHRSAARLRVASYFMPLLMLPFFIACMLLYGLLTNSLDDQPYAVWRNAEALLIVFTPYILILGYLYVLLADYGRAFARRHGWLTT